MSKEARPKIITAIVEMQKIRELSIARWDAFAIKTAVAQHAGTQMKLF